MTDRPDDAEAAALRALDDRMRRAVSGLQAAIGPAAEDDGIDEAAEGPWNGTGEMTDVEERAGGSAAGRRGWSVAAAAVVVVALAVGFVALRDDGRPSTVTDGAPGEGYLLPDWLPDDWGPVYAVLSPASSVDEEALGGPGDATVSVYGHADAEDPWSGPLLIVMLSEGQTLDDWWSAEAIDGDDHVEEIVVAGERAVRWTDPADPDGMTVSQAAPGDPDAVVTVGGYGVDEDVILAVAGRVDADLTWDDGAGLPDGFELLARGPETAIYAFGQTGPYDGLVLRYGTSPRDEDPWIGMLQEPVDDPSAAALLRLADRWLVDDEPGDRPPVEEIEVRGRSAYLRESAGDDLTVVQWYEPSLGSLVMVASEGVDRADLDRFVAGLRPADEDELARLVEDHGEWPAEWDEEIWDEDVAGEVVPLDGEEIPVADGEVGGDPWELTIIDWGGGHLMLELMTDSMSLGGDIDLDSSAGPPGGVVYSGDPDIGRGDDRFVPVIGWLDDVAAGATAELPDGSSRLLEVYEVDGWDLKVFVGFLPRQAGGVARVTAVDAGGEPLAGWPADVDLFAGF